MTRGLYTHDSEVVETRWRLHRASFRYLHRRHARLYLTGAACAGVVADWLARAACAGHLAAVDRALALDAERERAHLEGQP